MPGSPSQVIGWRQERALAILDALAKIGAELCVQTDSVCTRARCTGC